MERLYVHQAAAIDAVRTGRNVVVVTGTASGKTMCYNLPVLEGLLEDPNARALYLFPTKALAQDQLKGLKRFLDEEETEVARGRTRTRGGPRPGALHFNAGVYDGDTPTALRNRLRDEANLLLTNPDMLHSGILPNHSRWAEFFTRLRYIVVDEIHVYRGIFGSHVANVLRRLSRICRHYGCEPTWICASATIANPAELAEKLTGHHFDVVDRDGSPRGTKHFLLWNPPHYGATGLERKSSNLEARDLLVHLVREGYQVIAFVKARLLTEVLLRYCQEELRSAGGGLAKKIRAYRGGYLAEERRKIEAALFDGELLGVISTNALELGVDIGSLDVALMVGYPGTIASTWQQAGRAGRRHEESAAILIAHNAPLDQYLAQNPEWFFGQTPEQAVLDPANPHILVNHLRCAALEIPVTRDEEPRFGEYAPAILDLLQDRQVLKEIKGRWFYTRGDHPAATFSLRNSGDNVYTIIDATAGLGAGAPGSLREKTGRENRVIGTIDEASAYSQVHPQAIYMHEGETYFVDTLDLSERTAYIHRADLDYYTQAITDSHIESREPEMSKPITDGDLSFGECLVHEKVCMFKKIKFGTRDSLGFGSVELPDLTLHTTGLWFTPSAALMRRALDHGRVPADGLAGIANVLCEVISLFAMCDPLDLGTVVDMRTPQGPTLYVYDKYPGGLGYAQRAFHRIAEILPEALKLVAGCPCDEGCPSCVGSPLLPQYLQDPDAFMKGRIPDKEAAQILLHGLVGLSEYTPKVPLTGLRRTRAERLLAPKGGGETLLVETQAALDAATAEIEATLRRAEADPGLGASAALGLRREESLGREETTIATLPRDVRPLPPDLRRKLEAQLQRLEEWRPARRDSRRDGSAPPPTPGP
ncbi:MAG: DEAD/DEAH box helicase [Candidatus Eisenbacteria bacterium]|nr:DEAD/DEAH box helicase [Candidatus Eisenbacteria bacterium]